MIISIAAKPKYEYPGDVWKDLAKKYSTSFKEAKRLYVLQSDPAKSVTVKTKTKKISGNEVIVNVFEIPIEYYPTEFKHIKKCLFSLRDWMYEDEFKSEVGQGSSRIYTMYVSVVGANKQVSIMSI